ncbi:MAG: hypothetical protein H6Q20_2382 [Bacteroidetes bacterium]|nr:hypothetical protein [Bacteroidota bacterium]
MLTKTKMYLEEKIIRALCLFFLSVEKILVIKKKRKGMKKVLVILVVIFSTIASASALELYEYGVYYKLNNERTFNSLNKYLQLNDCQQRNLKTEFLLTSERIKKAVETGNEKAASDAMEANLNSLKEILSEEQYSMFVTALNTTIENSRTMDYLAAQ